MLKREVRRQFSYCPILGSLACLCSTWIHSVSLGASSDSLLVPSPGVSTWRSPPWSTWLAVWAGSNNTGPTPYVYRLLAVCQAQFQVLLHVIWFSPHHDQVPLRFSIYRWGKWSKGHAACNRPSLDLNLGGGATLEPFLLIPIMYWVSVTNGKCRIQHIHTNTPKEREHRKAKCKMRSADWW